MRGQLAVVQASIVKTESAVQEARARRLNIVTAFRAQAEDDLAKSRGDLAVLGENIKSAQDRVRRTELRSPARGVVNKLNVTTIGAVVAPGASLMEITPLDDTLLVEGRFGRDIAFVRPNHEAVVKLSAYDFRRCMARCTAMSSASAPTPSPMTRVIRTSAAKRSIA
ncbi:MAG: HlyD family efflux transporter periplasmic adaptor subunit [Rhodopseudomonas palustris]|nr:HlyD family efflux transporter periplasmic adaptor subunit [Rhodopseudomonas palustris]